MDSGKRNRKIILGIRVDDVSNEDMHSLFRSWIMQPAFRSVVTPNPEFVIAAQRNEIWRAIINQADLALPDGVGLQFATVALTGERIVYRQTGTDTIEKLCVAIAEKGGRVLLVGDNVHGTYGMGGLKRAQEVLAQKYPKITFEAVDPGKLMGEYPTYLVQRATTIQATAVLVALPMPLQMHAIEQHRAQGYEGVVMGVGGGLDMLAGTSPRAPRAWQKAGFEWLWRFLREPSRYKRMYRALIVFPCKIAYATWQQGYFLKSVVRVFTYLFTRSYVRN